MHKRRIIVIGGGAAGLMAAGQAAQFGSDVLVLEKMRRPGRKICITGKGRCNITNVAELPDFLERFSGSGKFLRQAFNHFFAPDLMRFFSDLGLKLVTERGGRVFPASGHAPQVLAVLVEWLNRLGVEIVANTRVRRMEFADNSVTQVTTSGKTYPADAVILATGGASYPATGSSGDGYALAQSAGHSIIPIRPALVPLETAGDLAGQLAGLDLKNINLTTLADGRKIGEEFGELTFLEFGVSGPVILKMSRTIVDALRQDSAIHLTLDMKPALDYKQLDARLIRDITARGSETFADLLRGLLPREMAPVLARLVDIPVTRSLSQISSRERGRLKHILKSLPLEVTGYRPFSEAIITAGGVHVKEIDPKTMASRFISNLYVVGELLDIQADTGGYNLQAAFSTGWVAGRSAAEWNSAE